ncbi:MAG: hypothetical protein LQ340_006593, partial [Diploschistes diacapsis]
RLHHARAPEPIQHHVPQLLYPALQLLVHFLQPAPTFVPVRDQILPRVHHVTALDVAHVALLGEAAQEDFGDGGTQDERFGGVGFGDFGHVGVRVRVVNLVEGEYGGEFGGYEGGDEGVHGFIGPGFEGRFEGEGV